MAVVNLTVVVPNLAEVLADFDRIKVYRASTLTAPPVEITDVSTRMVLAPGVVVYTYSDLAGSDAFFYRTSFFNSTTSLESSLSDAQQGSGDSALDVISVEELKDSFLFGLPLEDRDGNPMPDTMFQFYIRSAVAWVERLLDITLGVKTFTDAAPDTCDFYRQDYQRWIYLQLVNYPIIGVSRVAMQLPSQGSPLVFDPTWIRVDKDAGVIQVVPSGSIPLVVGSASIWNPAGFQADFIPDVFQISYTAGFAKGQVPPELAMLVGKAAAIGPLGIVGDLLYGPGLVSESAGLDGLMTSTRTNRTNKGIFGARLDAYQADIDRMVRVLRSTYRRFPMVVA